jgi:hypothetical protein
MSVQLVSSIRTAWEPSKRRRAPPPPAPHRTVPAWCTHSGCPTPAHSIDRPPVRHHQNVPRTATTQPFVNPDPALTQLDTWEALPHVKNISWLETKELQALLLAGLPILLDTKRGGLWTSVGKQKASGLWEEMWLCNYRTPAMKTSSTHLQRAEPSHTFATVWNQECFSDSADITSLSANKLIFFTLRSYMFWLLYQSHHQAKPLQKHINPLKTKRICFI